MAALSENDANSAAPADAVSAARAATYVAFATSGFAFASWASRIPQVRDRLVLDPSDLGLVLLAIAVGSLIALPTSGPVIARVGTQRTVTTMALLMSVALTIVSFGYLVGVIPVVIGLFLLGFANGAWDVAMNVQGAAVERRLGRSIMSRFHAAFSLGTVIGALLGAAAVALHVPVTPHVLIVAIVVGVLVPISVRAFLQDIEEDPAPVGTASEHSSRKTHHPFASWAEPRTLLIGVFVLSFAFAEGAGNDWVSVAVIDGYGVGPALGTLAFALFLAAMTIGRWFGPALLDRYGRVAVVRVLALLALLGLLLFVFAPVTALAYVGVLMWGAGVSLGFPVGMSAAADDPQRAAGRVSAVASIGYCAFLAGPPLIGFLGDDIGVLRSLTVVAVLLSISVLISGVLRSQTPERGSPMRTQ